MSGPEHTEWREVGKDTLRMRVPGGWLYRHVLHGRVTDFTSRTGSRSVLVTETMCFVPEPGEAVGHGG